MIYAIVTTYTDGHSETIFINQKAKNATSENACLMGFVFSDKTTGHKTLSISYVSELCNDNNIHPVAISNIDIDTMNVKKICVYNIDNIGDKTTLSSLLSIPYKS